MKLLSYYVGGLRLRITLTGLFIFTLWFIAVQFSPTSFAQASLSQLDSAPTDSACIALDLVIVLDQSDSMFRVNDRNHRRFEAANTIINYLGNQAVWLCIGQEIQHRVAVIGFGDQSSYDADEPNQDNPYREDVSVYLEPTLLPPVNDFDQWKADRVNIKNQVDGGRSENLRATDHRSGLLFAADILEEWRANPLPGIRRQAVIMITDGEPCLFWRGCDLSGVFYNIRPDMEAIREATDPSGSYYPWRGSANPDSVFLSTLIFSQRNNEFSQFFIDEWRAVSESHGGTLEQARQAAELSPIVGDMLRPIIGSTLQSIECNSDFWINPYINNLVILYAFALVDDPSADVEVVIEIESDGEIIIIDRGSASSANVSITEHVVDGQNEFYILSPPLPGRYRVQVRGEVDCVDLLDVRIDTSSVSASVILPTEQSLYPATAQPPFYNIQVADKFRVEVFDIEQNLLREFRGYPLQLTVEISSRDGDQNQTLNFQRLMDGVYESIEYIQTPIPGLYDWELKITVRNPQDSAPDINVFEDGDPRLRGFFSATEVALFGFSITSPNDGENLPLNNVSGSNQNPLPFSVEVALVDPDENPLDAQQVLNRTHNLFEASLYRGSQLIEKITLDRRPGALNFFDGVFTNSVQNAILDEGAYTIQVNALWDRDDYDILLYAPFNHQESIQISQYEIVPVFARILPPMEDLTLHKRQPLESFFGMLESFEFAVEFFDARNNTQLGLDEILVSKSDEFQARVIAPSGESETITMQMRQNERLEQLLGAGGLELNEEGEYEIRFAVSTILLNQGFAWAEAEQTEMFSRTDVLMTRPSFWRIAAAITGIVLLLFLIWLIYTLTGGPRGYIAVVGTNARGDEEIEGGPWRLRFFPRRNKVKNGWLKSRGVGSIVVKRATSIDPEVKHAVYAVAKSTTGMTLYEGILDNNMPVPFIESGDLVYKRSLAEQSSI